MNNALKGNLLGLLFLLGLFLFIPLVNASLLSSGDMTFSVNQKDYYFKTGENAIIPLNIKNTYGQQINGLLTYTYTQEVNQGGMHMSSSNSQSTSLSVEDGETTQGLNFGTSNSPSDLKINLKFVYTEKESRIVNLNDIIIHFVSDENQKQNQQSKQSSSSKEYSQSQQSQNSAQDPFSQMQKKLDQMMNNNQNNNQQSQNSQEALQNNQMAQDSSALKKQMENQLKEQEAMKQEFQKQLAQNQEFQKEHQKMLNQGYNLTDANLNPSSNNTGDFKLKYQNSNGQQSSLSGEMNNGTVKNIQKDTPETRQELLNKLQENKQFQKYQQQLQKQGYSKKNSKLSQQQDKTTINTNYVNKNNETATITAEAINNTIQKVDLQQVESQKQTYWWILLVFLFLLVGYFVYKKFNKKIKSNDVVVKKKEEKPFDYKSESIRLIEKSKKLFEQKNYKDAYGLAGQALRLFLSYENQLNKEITNDEIINFLRIHKKGYKEIKECFDLCSLVEFAKYDANKTDFNKIINRSKKIIN